MSNISMEPNGLMLCSLAAPRSSSIVDAIEPITACIDRRGVGTHLASTAIADKDQLEGRGLLGCHFVCSVLLSASEENELGL